MTNQGQESEAGGEEGTWVPTSAPVPWKPVMQKASAKPRLVAGGWGRQRSGGLVGDYSQREVLLLGLLSVHKYQRYALLFLLHFQTLRGRRKETYIFWAAARARHLCEAYSHT